MRVEQKRLFTSDQVHELNYCDVNSKEKFSSSVAIEIQFLDHHVAELVF